MLLLAPSWTTYKPQTLLSGRKAHTISTHIENEWRLTPELVEEVSLSFVKNNLVEIANFYEKEFLWETFYLLYISRQYRRTTSLAINCLSCATLIILVSMVQHFTPTGRSITLREKKLSTYQLAFLT